MAQFNLILNLEFIYSKFNEKKNNGESCSKKCFLVKQRRILTSLSFKIRCSDIAVF